MNQMCTESRFPVLSNLTHQSFKGMEGVHSVFNSCKTNKDAELLLRMLIDINNYPLLPTNEQLRELEDIVQSLASFINEGNIVNAFPSHDFVSSVGNNTKASLPKFQAFPISTGSFISSSIGLQRAPVSPSSGFSGDLANSRKHKLFNEPFLDRPSKRFRNGLPGYKDVCMTPGIGGWMEDRGVPTSKSSNKDTSVIISNGMWRATRNLDKINGGIGQSSVVTTPAASKSVAPENLLPSLLKDIGNPTNLGSIPYTNEIGGTLSENGAAMMTSTMVQNSAVEVQLPSEIVSVNTRSEVGGARLNPGDPRRVNFINKDPQDTPKHILNKVNEANGIPATFDLKDHKVASRATRIEEQYKMFSARKLILVLDLDHTLLNSTKFSEVEPKQAEILRKKEERDRGKPQRHLFRFEQLGLWTKLRPGIWNFLERASKLFELHINTMGSKMYANEIARVLDPTGNLFAGRIKSREDDNFSVNGDLVAPKHKDLDGVMGLESAVLIIDDCSRVWPNNKHNLIAVERYDYFPGSRKQFGLCGPSLFEIDHDEMPDIGTLASSLAVTERIHQNFFSHHDLNNVDARNLLASEQRNILEGCRILFSRIFPVEDTTPHLRRLWRLAEQFGAVCTNQIDEQVTHVVAKSLGTDKVNWALSKRKFVVQPAWLEASALLYRRAKEQDFALKQ